MVYTFGLREFRIFLDKGLTMVFLALRVKG
jgi:hypothetical protein